MISTALLRNKQMLATIITLRLFEGILLFLNENSRSVNHLFRRIIDLPLMSEEGVRVAAEISKLTEKA